MLKVLMKMKERLQFEVKNIISELPQSSEASVFSWSTISNHSFYKMVAHSGRLVLFQLQIQEFAITQRRALLVLHIFSNLPH